jgi:hypothetical protein
MKASLGRLRSWGFFPRGTWELFKCFDCDQSDILRRAMHVY